MRRYYRRHPAGPAGFDAIFDEPILPGYDRDLAGYDRAFASYGRDLADYDRDLAGYDRDLASSGRDLTDYDREFTGYDRDVTGGYSGDYASLGGYAGWPHRPGFAARRHRRVVPRPDWREHGSPGGAGEGGWSGAMRQGGYGASGASSGPAFRRYRRREPYPRGDHHSHGVPPDYWRYLDEHEYGLGPELAYDLAFRENRFRRGPLGPRNALFGGEGFRRYDRRRRK